jgi:acetylornithine deacetylase
MNKESLDIITKDAITLLQQLISIPSLSKEEDKTANCIKEFLQQRGITIHQVLNNLWGCNKHFDANKPSILLNSHHDTVPANSAYTRDPYQSTIENGKLFGLGSTDAGASLVSLMAAFIYYYDAVNMPYNIVFAASSEEEISGTEGIEKLFEDEIFFKLFQHPDSFAIVGEPTQLELAIAEKGLMVLDCVATGRAGHAAREEGDNAIYKAIEAINWFRNYRFEKISPLLGEVKMTVTSIQTQNKAHNVVPAQCSFVVDTRITELYSHEEVLELIKKYVSVDVTPRSTRLRSSSIDVNHAVVKAGLTFGKKTYGSPTASDQALIPLPSLKCGPGFSGQSHSADEFVAVSDIEDGIRFYISLLEATIKGYS